MVHIRNPKDVLAGGLFVIFAAVLAYNALQLPLGTASRMGPGYFPLALALILAVLGALTLFNGLRVDGDALPRFDWRGVALVILSVVAFAATIQWLGFVPAVVISVGVSMIASDRFRPLSAAGLIAFLLAFCWLVFIWGLGMPVRLFG
ncbi:tripartite tricarboxylate transporter TctB family protein [Microbaculum marinum]|uniref:Tripartite tricarboxylate transporter TctB family protein n=1 Tax=Microbaculum marinum TaxID=1764581 RepID=A0AAW9RMP3_9HYPH